MNLSNAAGLLSAASKATSFASKASPILSSIGGPYAGIAATVLDKVAKKAPGMLQKLESKLGNNDTKNTLAGPNAASMGIASANGETPASKAMDMIRDWDKDQDGVLSESELQTGLEELKQKIAKQMERAQGGDAYEKTKLDEYNALAELGQKMQTQFQKVSAFDNQAGISVSDIKLMAFQDKNPYAISKKELA